MRRPRTLWVALAFLVVGVTWFVVHDPSASVGMDDGAYAIAAEQVQEGSWSVPYAAARADPDGVAHPYPNAEQGADGHYYPYVRQPAWVVALAVADAIGGPFGMRLLVLAAGAGAVAATGLLARAAGVPEVAVLAAAFVALSPLAYNALQLWAHAPAALFTALAAVGAHRLMGDGRPGWAIATGVLGTFGSSLLRADGALFALAIGIVVVVVGVRSRRAVVALGGTAFGLAAVGGQFISSGWAGTIVGSGGPSGGGGTAGPRTDGGSSDRLPAALQTLLGQDVGSDRGLFLALLALLLVVAAVALARRDDGRAATVLLGAAALTWVVRTVTERDAIETGLLGAWPLVILALLVPVARWSDAERRLAVMVALGCAAVVWTQYGVGGGANWGGRFVSAGLPLLAVLTASSLCRWTRAHAHGRALMIAAVSLAAVTMVASLALDSHYRRRSHATVSAIEQLAPDRWVVTSSLALPNLAWRTGDEVRWLRVPSESSGGVTRLEEILDRLEVDEVVAIRLADADFADLTELPPERNDPDQPTTVRLAP